MKSIKEFLEQSVSFLGLSQKRFAERHIEFLKEKENNPYTREVDIKDVVGNPDKYVNTSGVIAGEVIELGVHKTPGIGLYVQSSLEPFFVLLGEQGFIDIDGMNRRYIQIIDDNGEKTEDKIYIGDYIVACGDFNKLFYTSCAMSKVHYIQVFKADFIHHKFAESEFTITKSLPLVPDYQYYKWEIGEDSITSGFINQHILFSGMDNNTPTDIVGCKFFIFKFETQKKGFGVISLDFNRYDKNGKLVEFIGSHEYLIFVTMPMVALSYASS